MRYAERITFIKETAGGAYNPESGTYDAGAPVEDIVPCRLTSLGIDRTNQLFGTIDKEITVARVQRPYERPYDYARINGKQYSVKRHIPHATESVFYLEGMA